MMTMFSLYRWRSSSLKDDELNKMTLHQTLPYLVVPDASQLDAVKYVPESWAQCWPPRHLSLHVCYLAGESQLFLLGKQVSRHPVS